MSRWFRAELKSKCEGRAECAAFVVGVVLDFFFDGEGQSFAAVEDASDDEDPKG